MERDRVRFSRFLEGMTTHEHACQIYETQEEQSEAVILFTRLGLERGERCLYIADGDASIVLDWMILRGIDVDTALKRGSLVVFTKDQAYLKAGTFDPKRMIQFWKESVESAKAAGFSTLRLAGDLTSVSSAANSRAERIPEYEVLLNSFVRSHDVLCMCWYNCNVLPEVLVNVFRTHPTVIYGWSVWKNAFYVPADEFLRPDWRNKEPQRWLKIIQSHEALKESLHDLSGRLLQVQDEERRRVTTLLHETVAQDLTVLKINLAILSRSKLSMSAREMVSESLVLADQCIKQVRSISHILHPPMLDEAGLATALRWYVSGFGKRTGIRIDLEIAPNLDRLPRDMETAAFRIVQESLTNIYRHSGSPLAKVTVVRDADKLSVEVEDEGCGMSPRLTEMSGGPVSLGIGIVGMQERVRQLGGRMEMQSGNSGTKVHVVLPVSGGKAWGSSAS